jgi:hypothetical protein
MSIHIGKIVKGTSLPCIFSIDYCKKQQSTVILLALGFNVKIHTLHLPSGAMSIIHDPILEIF